MIETLFRGIAKKGGAWVYGAYIPRDIDYITEKITEKPFIVISSEDKKIDGKWVEIIPETLGQYIRKRDKNGKMIFEGDIVKFGNDRFIVVYDCDLCAFMGRNDNCTIRLCSNKYIEVVGCIHGKGQET